MAGRALFKEALGKTMTLTFKTPFNEQIPLELPVGPSTTVGDLVKAIQASKGRECPGWEFPVHGSLWAEDPGR